MKAYAILAALSLAGCTTAQLNHADRLCAQASAAAATAEQIGAALAAAGVAPDKIAPIVVEIQRGQVILTASCAVIAATPPSDAHP